KHFPKDPHDAVARLVFDDVWDKDPQKDHRVSELARQVLMEQWSQGSNKDPQKDYRVSELARQVLMEYDEATQQPTSPPQLRLNSPRPSGPDTRAFHTRGLDARSGPDTRADPDTRAGPDTRADPDTRAGPDTRDPDARGKPLRLRVKSNMTFNLGDELLNWRRMQMAGPESESESASDDETGSRSM
ncbi:uncharacterized protein LOC133534025, partial [Cydia pomonella]|uniref:uncharacterized protein LOC133534025 n=1 Tax=Cydia pomonella TaxID=82600 RepID=UPI002ADDEC35